MTWTRWLRRATAVHRGRFVFSTVSVVLGVAAFVGVAGSLIGRATMTGVSVETELPQVFRFSPVAVPVVIVLALLAGTIAGRIAARCAAATDPAVILRSL